MRETELGSDINQQVFVKEEFLALLPGESRKPSDVLGCISAVNRFMGEYLGDVDLEQMPVVIPEQFHILGDYSYFEAFSESELRNHPALCYVKRGIAFFNEDGFFSSSGYYKALFHEAIHLMQMQGFREQAQQGMKSEIEGYEEHENSNNFLVFITEAMVDRVLLEMSTKYGKEMSQMVEGEKQSKLYEQFGVGMLDEASFYFFHIEVLDSIVKRIAKVNGESEDDVWKRFKKSFFESKVDHLKEIENVFGDEAVAIIDAGFSLDPEVCPRVLKYFEIDDEQERERIAVDILKK